MGWLDAPLAGQDTQKWQNAPLLEGVPPYRNERTLAFGSARYLPPDYNSPDWIPDYSEEGVRAMRERRKYLFDKRYEDVTKEQLAERERLTAALKRYDNPPLDLGETTLTQASPDAIYQRGFKPLDQVHAAATSSIYSVPFAGPPADQGIAWVLAQAHNALKPDDVPITMDDVVNVNRQRENANRKGTFAGQIIGSTAPFLAAARVAALAKLLGFEGQVAERLGYGTLSQYGINTGDGVTRDGKTWEQSARDAFVPTLLAAPLSLVGGPRPTGNVVAEELRKSGIGADDAKALLDALGPKGVLADLSPRLQAMLADIVSRPGPAQKLVIEAMQPRAAGAGDRLKAGLEEILGAPRIPSHEAAAIEARKDALLLDEAPAAHVPGTTALDDQFNELTRQQEGLDLGALALRNGDTPVHPTDFGDAFAAGVLPEGQFIGPSGVPVRIQQGMIADIARIIGTETRDPAALRDILTGKGTWNREKLATAFGEETAERLTRLFDGEVKMAATKEQVDAGLGAEIKRSAPASLQPALKDGILLPLMKGSYGDAALQALNRLTGGIATAEQRMVDEAMALALLGRVIPAVSNISPPLLLSALARGGWSAAQ